MLIWTMPFLQKGLKMNQTIYEKEKKKELKKKTPYVFKGYISKVAMNLFFKK